jgi:hypothetical protein
MSGLFESLRLPVCCSDIRLTLPFARLAAEVERAGLCACGLQSFAWRR